MSTIEHPHRQMIKKFVDALREQDFLDENFDSMTNLHENQNPLVKFCSDAELDLERADSFLKNDGDFEAVFNIMEQMMDHAARVGGKRVAVACSELLKSCKEKSLVGSREALKKATWEYYILRDCFHHVLQAERSIHTQTERAIQTSESSTN